MPVAVVIGGARRLGRSISLQLAAHGYDVGITFYTSSQQASSLEREVTDMGRAFDASMCDVRHETELIASWQHLVAKLGAPDVVVVCAGVFPDRRHPVDVSIDHVVEALKINTLPLVTVAQQYALLCNERRVKGRLVSIGSLGAVEIWNNRLAYNMSKSAARTAALSLARSLAPTISVNIVAPGAIAQPEDQTAADASLIPTERIPMGRHGTDADVCEAVMFFASASHYITGQTIYVDGGYGLTR
jgi:NAD(P)-dependent dehydrogenase (short-subunit alcohol dehydrogenase family)